MSDVKLPSAGEIVPDSELVAMSRNVRAPRMRGMVSEREFSNSPFYSIGRAGQYVHRIALDGP